MIHITERSGSSARQETVRKESNGKNRRKCEKCVMLGTEKGKMKANEWRNEGPERNREREGGRKRRRKEQEQPCSEEHAGKAECCNQGCEA